MAEVLSSTRPIGVAVLARDAKLNIWVLLQIVQRGTKEFNFFYGPYKPCIYFLRLLIIKYNDILMISFTNITKIVELFLLFKFLSLNFFWHATSKNTWQEFTNNNPSSPLVAGKSSIRHFFLRRYPCSSSKFSSFSLWNFRRCPFKTHGNVGWRASYRVIRFDFYLWVRYCHGGLGSSFKSL